MPQKPKPSTTSSQFLLVIIVIVVILFTRWNRLPWLALALPAWFVLLPYLAGPFLTHRTHTLRLDQGFELIDPLGPDFPEVAARHAEQVESQMEILGFAIDGYYRLTISAPNTSSYLALFQNQATGEVSKSSWIVVMSKNPTLATSYHSFITHFSDETTVSTSNVSTTRAHPTAPPPSYGFTFPEIRQTISLNSIHQKIVNQFESGRIRVDLVGGNCLGYLNEREIDRHFARIIENGYYVRDDEAMLLRPTWKGAALMTWKLCWPIKQIQLARRRVSARSLLRKLEAGTWAP